MAMDDIDFDLEDLGDLENIDCDWENTLEGIAFDPPSAVDLQQQQQPEQQQRQRSNGRRKNTSDRRAYASSRPDNTASKDAAQIRLDREREGRCADCGAQTHQIQMDPTGTGRVVKIPLSVPGEVHRGRCLFCHPLPQSHRAAVPSGSQPRQAQRTMRQMEPPPTLDDLHELARNGRFENQFEAQDHNPLSSSASVCTANSHQSSHSAFSQHSAPVNWAGRQQYQQQMMRQQQNNQGFSQEVLEQYQQMQLQQQQMQQQQYADDSGSVYSQTSQASFHSNVSHQSHATYNSFIQHGLRPSLNTPLSSSNNEYSPVIENILIQMQDDSLNFESVLQAMSNFPSHALIQEKGCAILWVQTYNAEICLALSNMGGVSALLEAMRNHPHVPRLQRAACEALRNMCVLPINRQLLLNQGGIAVLVESMQMHAEDAQMQRSGCTALATVAEGGMEYKIGVAESGGILAVMKAVESHPENDLVLRSAYQALRMLGYNPGARSGD
ncbi:hypothetical protein ACHAWX_005680 [Stephanocyclus meneghinianus]